MAQQSGLTLPCDLDKQLPYFLFAYYASELYSQDNSWGAIFDCIDVILDYLLKEAVLSPSKMKLQTYLHEYGIFGLKNIKNVQKQQEHE